MDKTRRYIATSALISLTVLVMAEQSRTGELPRTKQLMAYGFVFFFLSAAADLGGEFAGAFAILAMVSITLEQGEDALKFVNTKVGTK